MAFYVVLRIASLFSVFFLDQVQADLASTCSSLTTAQWNYFYEGTCYAAHGSPIDWTMNYFEAAQSCNDIPGLEGHLAVFPDGFETLFPYMPYVFTVAEDFTLFLGLRRQGPIVADNPDENWFWVFPDDSRNKLGPGFWIANQPDQSTVNGTKNFGVFMRRGSSFGLGAHDSSPTNGYVCQYDPQAVTGSIPAGASPPPSSPEPEASTTPQRLPASNTTSSMITKSTTISSKTANDGPVLQQTILPNATSMPKGNNTAQNTTILAGYVDAGQAGQTTPPKNKAEFAGHSTIIILAMLTVAALRNQDYDQT